MIYRILVDNTWTIFLVPPRVSGRQLVINLHRQGALPTEALRRLEQLSQSPVTEVEPNGQIVLRLAARPIDVRKRLIGAGFGTLANVMDERGLRTPALMNARARFYFTELGWRQVGRFVASRARQMGHAVKVIRRKNPRSSEIAYRDAYQLALLPSRSRRL